MKSFFIVLLFLVISFATFAQQPPSAEECITNIKLIREQAAEDPDFKNQIIQSYHESAKQGISIIAEKDALEIIDSMFDESTSEEEACANVLNAVKSHSVKSAKASFAKECPKMVSSIRSSFALMQQYAPESLEHFFLTSSVTFTRLGYTAEEALPFFKNKVVNEEMSVDSICEEITDKYVQYFESQYGVESDAQDPLLNGPFSYDEEDSDTFASWLLPLIRYGSDEEESDKVNIALPSSFFMSNTRINPALILNPSFDAEEEESDEIWKDSKAKINPVNLLNYDDEEDDEEESEKAINPVILMRPARKPASSYTVLADKIKVIVKEFTGDLAVFCKKKHVYRPEYWLLCKK